MRNHPKHKATMSWSNLNKDHRQIVVIATYFIVSSLVIVLVNQAASSRAATTPEEVLPSQVQFTTAPELPTDLSLSASSVFVKDLTSDKILFSKNPARQVPLASLTKLMTGIVSVDKLTGGNIEVSYSGMGDAQELRVGDKYSIGNLLDITLTISSNSGAASLGKAITEASEGKTAVDLMNEYAQELGMKNTFFSNTTGLDSGGSTSGSYGSAMDVATLLSHINKFYPDLLSATRKSTLVRSGRTFSNTDELAGKISGLVGGKTGTTKLAGGNLALIYDAGIGHPIAIVILGSTESGRFADAKTIISGIRSLYVSR